VLTESVKGTGRVFQEKVGKVFQEKPNTDDCSQEGNDCPSAAKFRLTSSILSGKPSGDNPDTEGAQAVEKLTNAWIDGLGEDDAQGFRMSKHFVWVLLQCECIFPEQFIFGLELPFSGQKNHNYFGAIMFRSGLG